MATLNNRDELVSSCRQTRSLVVATTLFNGIAITCLEINFCITFKITIIMHPDVLRKELLICVERHLTKAIFTPYRIALAQARKPYRIGLLFTHKNGVYGANTGTEH